MRTLLRNQTKLYYCLYDHEIPIVDEYGNETSEIIVVYREPVEMKVNISPATGQSNTEQFGNLENYDKVIVTNDLNCPIDENSVLFIDKEPEFKEVHTHDVTESETVLGDDDVEVITVEVPVYNYIVKRVAKSLNSISIAVRKVEVK